MLFLSFQCDLISLRRISFPTPPPKLSASYPFSEGSSSSPGWLVTLLQNCKLSYSLVRSCPVQFILLIIIPHACPLKYSCFASTCLCSAVLYCYYLTKNDDGSAVPFSAFCTPLFFFGDRKQRVRGTTSFLLPAACLSNFPPQQLNSVACFRFLSI
jgi:hypothetical protein